MKRSEMKRIALCLIALVLILPGFIIHEAMAEATMAIEASVAAEGVSVQESLYPAHDGRRRILSDAGRKARRVV